MSADGQVPPGTPVPSGRGAADDDGAADPRLVAALQAWRQAPAPPQRAAVLAALSDARVFVPITATATEQATDAATGLRSDKASQMALLTLVDDAGRRALPVFADTDAVRRWRPGARPVPVAGPQACAAARDDGAAALLVDPDGARFLVAASEVDTLARGWVPVAGSGLAARRTTAALGGLAHAPDPDLVAALAAALADEPLRAARLLAGPDGPVLGVVPTGTLDAAALAALGARVAGRLGARLPAAGLDLAVVPAAGPGHPLPLPPPRRRRWGRGSAR